MKPIYQSLGYDFPRVLTLDVKDCVFVEVENPLARPFAMSTFWLPNVLLYCDYLISICPFKVSAGHGDLTIKNLLSLLPVNKYQGPDGSDWGALRPFGMDKVIADLYFTLPFDMGIIDGRKKLVCTGDTAQGKSQKCGKMFIGEPYEVDREASRSEGLVTEYLQWIEVARAQMEDNWEE
jgi:hypothetical protein